MNVDEKEGKQLLEELECFFQQEDISKNELASELGIPFNTLEKWFSTGKRKRPPSSNHKEKIKAFLQVKNKEKKIPKSDCLVKESQRRADKIKYLLLFLEEELKWFQEEEVEARNVFREKLDPGDIGYIAGLLGMLCEEDRFKRWNILTTMKFNRFKGGVKS